MKNLGQNDDFRDRRCFVAKNLASICSWMSNVIIKTILFFLLLLPAQQYCVAQTAAWQKLKNAENILQAERVESADTLLRELEKLPVKEANWQLHLNYLRALYYNAKEDLVAATKLLIGLPEKAAQQKLFSLAAKADILMALVHEKTDASANCKLYLDKAQSILDNYQLDSLYGWYYVRLSSYYRGVGNSDTALYFAKKALPYAEKYQDLRALGDANFLVGTLLKAEDIKQAIFYYEEALKVALGQQNYATASLMYANLSNLYRKQGDMARAMAYNDSATTTIPSSYPNESMLVWRDRSEFFRKKGNFDSALYYYEKYADARLMHDLKREDEKIKNLSLQHETDKKEAIIKVQHKQLLIAIAFSLLILLALLALSFQNRKIKRQHKKIEQNADELSKLLQQKKTLLSELQHRVKNNLQHILSLLDIQKESLSYNDVQEVIRENQNRVHSMALLHSKLSFADGDDKVNFEAYLHEMAELIKAAYINPKKEIDIQVNCRIAPLSIETAIPLGLVLVELMSNSLKHAFKEKQTGLINIDVSPYPASGKNVLEYSDNGCGFDFEHPNKEGIGLELINGLLTEINATVHTNNLHGTEYTILF